MRSIPLLVSLVAIAIIVGSATTVLQKDYPPQLAVEVSGVPGYIYYNRTYDLSIEYANHGGAVSGPVEIVAELPETFALAETISDPTLHGERLVWTLDGLGAGEKGSIPITVQGTLPDDLTNAVYDLPGYAGHTAFVEGFEMPVSLTSTEAAASTLAVADTGIVVIGGSIEVSKVCLYGDYTAPIPVSIYQNGVVVEGPENIFCDIGDGPTTLSFGPLNPGTYQVVETPNGDFATEYGTAGTCDGDGVIEVVALEIAECEITNTVLGGTGGFVSITVIKEVDGGNAQDFTFSSDIPGDTASFPGSTGCMDLGILDDDADPLRSDRVSCFGIPGAAVYNVWEEVPAGWELTSVVCTGVSPYTYVDYEPGGNISGVSIDLSQAAPNVQLSIQCTFTNAPIAGEGTGTIVIRKDAIPNSPDDTETFSFIETPDIPGCVVGPLYDDGSDLGNEVTCSGVPVGEYTVTEADPDPDYILGNVTCQTTETSGDTTVTSPGGRSATIDLDEGETVTCTFFNRYLNSLTVEKHCFPSDDPGRFTFQILDSNQQQVHGLTNVACDSEFSIGGFDGDTFQVVETGGTDTDLSDYVTTFGGDCDSQGFVTVGDRERLTCTVTNTVDTGGSLTIIKDVLGGEHEQDFPFEVTTLDGCPTQPITLDDDGDENNDYPSSFMCVGIDWSDISPGVEITEDVPYGWQMSDQSTCVGNVGDGEWELILDNENRPYGIEFIPTDRSPDGDIVCYIYNDPPDIELIKTCEPYNDQDLFTIEIVDGQQQVIDETTLECDGTDLLQLPPGTYSVREVAPGGNYGEPEYAGDCENFVIPDRDADTGPVVPTGNVDVADIFVIPTCTITNTQEGGSLTIIKDVEGGTSTETFFFVTDIPGCSLGTLDDDGDNTNAYSNTSVTCPVTWDQNYEVTENQLQGWELVDVSCNDINNDPVSGGIVIMPGQGDLNRNITCTFYNAPPNLELIKECDPYQDEAPFTVVLTPEQGEPIDVQILCDETILLHVDAGTYQVSEEPSDYEPDFSDCGTDGEFVIEDRLTAQIDGAVVCTVLNERTTGTIVIIKDVPGQDPTNFSFFDDIPDCDIGPLDDDSGSGTPSSTTCSDVPAGPYTVSELSTPGWDLDNIICESSLLQVAGFDVDVPSSTVDIDLEPGETVTCVFYNDPRENNIPEDPDGSITIVKRTNEATSDVFSFSSLSLGNFSLHSDGSRTFSGLNSGIYVVSEIVPEAWSFYGIDCGPLSVTVENGPTVTIRLRAGEDVTCEFTNRVFFTEEDDAPDPTVTPTKTPAPTVTPDPTATATPLSSDIGGITPPSTGDGGTTGSTKAWAVMILAAFAGAAAIGLRLAGVSLKGTGR